MELIDKCMTEKDFRYNHCGVCLNPLKVLSLKNKYCALKIEAVRGRTGWHAGYRLSLYQSVSLHGVCRDSEPRELTACIYDILAYSIRQANRELEYYSSRCIMDDDGEPQDLSAVGKYIKSFLKLLQEKAAYYDPQQLNLFN